MTRILNRPFWIGILGLIALMMVGGRASAQQIPWSVVSNGASFGTSGTITLMGTVGQTAIGTAEGGSLTAYQGFWVPFQKVSGVQVGPVAGETRLRNYPNPFNTTTTIYYEVAERSQVRVRVYNMSGQEIRELVDDVQSGNQQVIWDGNDEQAQKAASGTYLYRVEMQPLSGAANAKGSIQLSNLLQIVR